LTTLRAAALAARDRLLAASVAEDGVEAEIEAEVLLRFALETESASPVSRSALYAHYEDEATPRVHERFESLLTRRLAREPTAYITGRREFYGPETELLVETTLKLAPKGSRLRIADIGTGSGAIAVALAKALPWAELMATDVSRAALSIAAENAALHGVPRHIAFRAGQLLTPLHDYVDLIVANLPYVTTDDWSHLEPELREHEPRLALDGGRDGLDLIRALLLQAPHYLRRGGQVVLEIGEGQARELGRFIDASLPEGTSSTTEPDFAGVLRVMSVRLG
jgi:release factor glutamine methyltransferase